MGESDHLPKVHTWGVDWNSPLLYSAADRNGERMRFRSNVKRVNPFFFLSLSLWDIIQDAKTSPVNIYDIKAVGLLVYLNNYILL